MILPGSYANGFAPRDGHPLYPELWRGCVGAWAPCLGPTGLTLRDWSGFSRHGTLTNMDAAGDWVPTQGRYALDLDNTNDEISTPFAFPGTQYCVSFWENCTSSTAVQARIEIPVVSSSRSFAIVRITSGSYTPISCGLWNDIIAFRAASAPTIASSVGIWRHWIVQGSDITSNTPANHEIWCDGISYATSAASTFAAAAKTVTRIGLNSQNQAANALVDDLRVYTRKLSAQEIRLLASRRGIAYEMAPRRRTSLQVAAFNRRRRLLVGAGS